MSELMHVDVIAMHSLQVSRQRPHFHPGRYNRETRPFHYGMLVQPLGADSLFEKRNENERIVSKPGIFAGTTSKAQWCTGEKAHQNLTT